MQWRNFLSLAHTHAHDRRQCMSSPSLRNLINRRPIDWVINLITSDLTVGLQLFCHACIHDTTTIESITKTGEKKKGYRGWNQAWKYQICHADSRVCSSAFWCILFQILAEFTNARKSYLYICCRALCIFVGITHKLWTSKLHLPVRHIIEQNS